MDEEKSPLTAQDGALDPHGAAEADAAPENVTPRPEYTKKQRIIALLGAIFVVIVTLMYVYSISTGDLFFR